MASATATIRPTPVQIARAAALALPGEVSTRPLLGTLGVLIGAGLVTLTGRMLSLGLADLKGHVGISYDAGAWLDSAYNASLMFIGPFSVYLGGVLGPRRVLLFAAGVFTVTCTFLPLIHSYSLLVAALIVAGLTSGTFYPLTLTFALRALPLGLLLPQPLQPWTGWCCTEVATTTHFKFPIFCVKTAGSLSRLPVLVPEVLPRAECQRRRGGL